jgi:hypothetical protein
MKTYVTCALLLVSLVGCNDPQEIAQQPPLRSSEPQKNIVEDRRDTAGELCMPCVGPHFNFGRGGGISLFSMGPGISF